MHKTQAFKTCDGKLFDNECDAARHEATVKIHEWAERRKINGSNKMTWDAVAEAMLEDADELAFLFLGLAQSLPKNAGFVNVGAAASIAAGSDSTWLGADA